MTVAFTIPIRTRSKLNQRVHWAVRAKAAKAERDAVHWAWPRTETLPPLPVLVTMTRVAPGELDNDNLAGALKSIRDGIASKLGVDDRDPRVEWACAQKKSRHSRKGLADGHYAVDVTIAPLVSVG